MKRPIFGLSQFNMLFMTLDKYAHTIALSQEGGLFFVAKAAHQSSNKQRKMIAAKRASR
jgi:hypothetical protein